MTTPDEPVYYLNFTSTCQHCGATVRTVDGVTQPHECVTTPDEHRRNATEQAIEDVLLAYGLEPRSVLGAAASDVYRAVTAAVDEIVADLRRAFAEEAAQAIEERHSALVAGDEWDDGTDSLTAAAAIVREIGGIA